jgi:hypothetical protein
MRGHELEPFIGVQASEKRVGLAVFTEIPASRFFDERKGSLSNFPQFPQHFFLLMKKTCVHGERSFAPDKARFHERHWHMKSLKEGQSFGRLLQQFIGAPEDGPLHSHYVAYQFSSGLAAFTGAHLPLFCRYGISGAQEIPLCSPKFLGNALESWHGFIESRTKKSNRSSASPFERMRQLQDSRFPKGRAEDLQPHRQLSVDFSARHGDPRDARE